jgi:hypothetical protein
MVRAAIAIGLLGQALSSRSETTAPPPPPPPLEIKVKNAPVILVATVGEMRYYQWSMPIPGMGPRIAKQPADGFDPYVKLMDVKVLHGNEYAALIDAKSKNHIPLWARHHGCFRESGEEEPKQSPKRVSRILCKRRLS